MTRQDQKLPRNYRWNYTAFLLDYVFFGIAFNFFSPHSVLPGFVGRLTDKPLLIGLASAVFHGSWLLPQLAFARLIGDKPRKSGFMRAGLSGRPLLGVIALALWLGLSRNPAAMLIVFFVCLGLWALTDGATSVAWFDILARSIPMKARSRLMGSAQVISGVFGMGAGALIGFIIAERSFPADYALIFTIGTVILVPSALALIAIREPPPTRDAAPPTRKAKRSWLKPWTEDRAFRQLMACRVMVGLVGMATAFYVAHATKELMLPDSVVGVFTMALTAASIVSSAVLGLVAARSGPRYAMRIGAAAAVAAPLLAVVFDIVDAPWVAYAYPLVYVALGIINSSWMPGFLNYMMEIPPEGQQAAYMGLGNTIMGVLPLAPIIGGWLLDLTSYTVLFGATAAAVAIGLVLTWRIGPAEQPARATDSSA